MYLIFRNLKLNRFSLIKILFFGFVKFLELKNRISFYLNLLKKTN